MAFFGGSSREEVERQLRDFHAAKLGAQAYQRPPGYVQQPYQQPPPSIPQYQPPPPPSSIPQYQPPPPLQPPPIGMDVNLRTGDAKEDERLERYISHVPVFTVTDPRFMDLPNFTEDFQPVTTDFRDDRFLQEKSILFQTLETRDLVLLGRGVMPMLVTGFDHAGITGVFTLAFHLLSPGGGRVFDDATFPSHIDDVDMTEYGDIVEIMKAQPIDPRITHPSGEASAYAFIAASLLRLFSKSEENYVKAFPHIVTGYTKIYGSAMCINPPTPTVEAIRTLSHQFAHCSLYKMSLYRLLYAGSTDQKNLGIRKFLYELHLANTGMHVVGMFARICCLFKCTTGLLLTMLNTPMFSRQLDALMDVLKMGSSKEPQYSRNMWRYGRIFDETFMTPLQTKSCAALVYTLASALKFVAPHSHQDILNIKQLEDVGHETRRRLQCVGQNLIKALKKSMHTPGSSERFTILHE